jgi:hypothetical protein
VSFLIGSSLWVERRSAVEVADRAAQAEFRHFD